ncbi:MAG: hypothetical protein FJX77_10580, partial [Armatimonadetes bacterium]|nr:hypothetical protein [Armatimonadota bacterium]
MSSCHRLSSLHRGRKLLLTVPLLAVAGLSYGEEPLDPLGAVQPATAGTRGPYEVAFTPDGGTAIVTESEAAAVALIDTASGKVLRHVSVPAGPTGATVTPDGQLAVVTCSTGNAVAFLTLPDGKV